jgi:hypothetical protein
MLAITKEIPLKTAYPIPEEVEVK